MPHASHNSTSAACLRRAFLCGLLSVLPLSLVPSSLSNNVLYSRLLLIASSVRDVYAFKFLATKHSSPDVNLLPRVLLMNLVPLFYDVDSMNLNFFETCFASQAHNVT
jgi:hypothetical protein